jgi:hypothetical protein
MPIHPKRRLTRSNLFIHLRGFTLVELLVAAFLTLTVVSVSGWAVANMTALSRSGAAQNERRIELNRALDFISAEIRQSSKINGDEIPLPPEFSSPANAEADAIQPVLRLTIQNIAHPIIYYIASPKPGVKTWLGPKMIYRWGPEFDTNGNYSSTTWTHQPLVDAIEETTATPACETGWTASPKLSPTGFHACIDPQNRVAQLIQSGKLTRSAKASVPYTAKAQVFARASGYTPNLYAGCASSCIQTPPDSPPRPVTVSYQLVGSDLRCGVRGDPVKVRAIIRMTPPPVGTSPIRQVIESGNPTPIVFAPQPAGTTIDYTGVVLPQDKPKRAEVDPPYLLETDNNPDNTCGLEEPSGPRGFNSETNPKQVIVLHHGEKPPSYAGFGDGSQNVKGYLRDYIDAEGNIKLPNPEQQVIVLFELWSTDTDESMFDMQDLVLLATFTS